MSPSHHLGLNCGGRALGWRSNDGSLYCVRGSGRSRHRPALSSQRTVRGRVRRPFDRDSGGLRRAVGIDRHDVPYSPHRQRDVLFFESLQPPGETSTHRHMPNVLSCRAFLSPFWAAGWVGWNLVPRSVLARSVRIDVNDLDDLGFTDRQRFLFETLQPPNDISAGHLPLSRFPCQNPRNRWCDSSGASSMV
jgi:hypothetical protein